MFGNPVVVNAIIGAIALLAGPFLLKFLNKKDSNYDQIQEDLKEMRLDLKTNKDAAMVEREKDRKENREMKAIIIHLDNEITQLRQDVLNGLVPPLPPRPPWPVVGA